jgi:hypothetical protein
VRAEHVQVLPERARHEFRTLRDDGNLRAQLVQVEACNRDAIVIYVALREDAPQKCERQCALAAPGTADCKASLADISHSPTMYLTNTDALSRFDVEGDVVEHDRTVRRVPRNKLLDAKVARSWPRSWGLATLARRNFLLNIEVTLDALQAR